jgi:predicted O-methyltransferase YrrM
MSAEQWTTVDHYFETQLLGQDAVLDAALRATAEAGLPLINVSPSQGKLLHLIALMQGAQRILEVGTLAGYSTIWLARALPDYGRLVTLEIDPKHAAVAEANIARAGLSDRVSIMVGSAHQSLPTLVANGSQFDLVFIDADKVSTPTYLDYALKLTRPGSIIIIDNVVRNGAVTDAHSTDASVLGVRGAVDMLHHSLHLSATAIQTVGSKGYDGFIIARVNA